MVKTHKSIKFEIFHELFPNNFYENKNKKSLVGVETSA